MNEQIGFLKMPISFFLSFFSFRDAVTVDSPFSILLAPSSFPISCDICVSPVNSFVILRSLRCSLRHLRVLIPFSSSHTTLLIRSLHLSCVLVCSSLCFSASLRVSCLRYFFYAFVFLCVPLFFPPRVRLCIFRLLQYGIHTSMCRALKLCAQLCALETHIGNIDDAPG